MHAYEGASLLKHQSLSSGYGSSGGGGDATVVALAPLPPSPTSVQGDSTSSRPKPPSPTRRIAPLLLTTPTSPPPQEGRVDKMMRVLAEVKTLSRQIRIMLGLWVIISISILVIEDRRGGNVFSQTLQGAFHITYAMCSMLFIRHVCKASRGSIESVIDFLARQQTFSMYRSHTFSRAWVSMRPIPAVHVESP